MLDLAAIRERMEKATAGPWAFRYTMSNYWPYAYYVVIQDKDRELFIKADADFIAHARTDIPALIEEVERLRAALKPFAKAADYWDEAVTASGWPDDTTLIIMREDDDPDCTIGDLRRARSSLSTTKEP